MLSVHGIPMPADECTGWLRQELGVLIHELDLDNRQKPRDGNRWRSYRRSAEYLKRTGWQLFQLRGAYALHDRHAAAPVGRAAAIDNAILDEVKLYVTQVTREREHGTGAAPAESAAG
jgi:hypothetical protein